MNKKILSKLKKFQKAKLPILSCVKIQDNWLTVFGINTGTVEYSARHEIQVAETVIIPIDFFCKIAEKFPVQRIVREKDKAILETEQGNFSALSEDIQDFPDTLDVTGPSRIVDGKLLRRMRRYCSTDDLRPAMQGVYFDPSGYNVATNGHILWKERTLDGGRGRDFIMPSWVIELMDDSEYNHSKGTEYNGLFSDSEIIAYQPINDMYPKWKTVVPDPENSLQDMRLDKADLKKAIEAGLVASNSVTATVILETENGVVWLRGGDEDMQQTYESGHIGTAQGSDFRFGFNGKYMLQLLSDIDSDTVKIQSVNGHGARIVNGKFLLMPILQDTVPEPEPEPEPETESVA